MLNSIVQGLHRQITWSTSLMIRGARCLWVGSREQREESAPLYVLLHNTSVETKLALLFLKKWALQETQLWNQKRSRATLRWILHSHLFHAACSHSKVAIFISYLQPSCCFMLTWRLVWKSQQRRMNPTGPCLLSFLEQIKCHELQWGMDHVHFTNRGNENISDI